MPENTYLHTMYPNLTPQIDQGIKEGIPLDVLHETIQAKINMAKNEGIPDDVINKTIGVNENTVGGYNPFIAQAYRAAGAFNKGLSSFTKGMIEPGQYLSEKLGFGRSKLFDEIVNKATNLYDMNAVHWDEKAKEKGAGFIDELIGDALGGGITGIPEFMLGVPYATAQGAVEAKSKGQSEMIGAITGLLKREILGKLFHTYGSLTKPLAATAMGGTMAVETAASGGNKEEVAKAFGTGALYSLGGKGRIGIREVKDSLTGKVDYKPEIRTDAEIAADMEKQAQEIKKDEVKRTEEVKKQKDKPEGEPPTETYDEFIKAEEGDLGGAKARKETLLLGKLEDIVKDAKVSSLTGNIDKELNRIIKTADELSRAAFASGDKMGAKREHDKMVDIQHRRAEIKKNYDDLKKEVYGTIGKIKKRLDIENMDADYKDKLQEIMEDYDLAVRTNKTLAKRESMRDFVERMEANGDTVLIPEKYLDMMNRKAVNDMTLDELRGLDQLTDTIARQGKLKKKLQTIQGRRTLEQTVTTLDESIKTNALGYNSKGEMDMTKPFPSEREITRVAKLKQSWNQFFSQNNKIEMIVDLLDGLKDKAYKTTGMAYNTVFDPIYRSENRKLELTRNDADALEKIMEPIKKDFLSMMKDRNIQEAGHRFTSMEAVMLYMNSKNAGNRTALKKGYNLSDDDISNIVGKLTPQQIAFGDNIMKHIQSKGGDIAQEFRKLTGENMKFEDDYFPLWFDKELSDRVLEQQQLQDLSKEIYRKYGPDKQFTIERMGGTDAPFLSFEVVVRHLEKVNQFISYANSVKDVQKVLFDKRIKASITNAIGEGGYGELTDWLRYQAHPTEGYQGSLDKAYGMLRHNATLVSLGLKVSTALLQPTAYLQLMNRIGVGNGMKGLYEFYRDPFGMTDVIYNKSEAMRARKTSFDRELQDYLKTDGFYNKHQIMKEMAMGIIQVMDLATTLPAWQSAYRLGIKNNMAEAEAISYADRVTRLTQASSLPKDLPGVLRGNNFKKSLTMFYTYFSSTYNEFNRDLNARKAGTENIGDVIKSFMFLFIIPSAIQVLMKKREQTTGGEFVKELAGNVAGTVPYIGPIANAAITGFDYQPSPIYEFPKEVIKTANAAIKGKPGPFLKHGTMVAGYLTGFPARQSILTAQYLGDVLSGRSYDPTNLIYREQKKKSNW